MLEFVYSISIKHAQFKDNVQEKNFFITLKESLYNDLSKVGWSLQKKGRTLWYGSWSILGGGVCYDFVLFKL